MTESKDRTRFVSEGKALILSASRRTDLPGYHASSAADRIRKRIDGLRTRRLAGVVFWTKHFREFLPLGALHELVRNELSNPVINFTVTGLGGTGVEPGAPSVDEVLKNLPRLIEAFHGEPWRIRWRFDPILKGHSSLNEFRRIASQMSANGVLTCTFSFPAYASLKGDLTEQFEKAGIPKWHEREKAEFLAQMARIAADLDIELLSCAQPGNAKLVCSVKEAQCIPADVLERGSFGQGHLSLPKDRSQRTHCRCVESEDIGDYERDQCFGGCAYCYSKAGGPLDKGI